MNCRLHAPLDSQFATTLLAPLMLGLAPVAHTQGSPEQASPARRHPRQQPHIRLAPGRLHAPEFRERVSRFVWEHCRSASPYGSGNTGKPPADQACCFRA